MEEQGDIETLISSSGKGKSKNTDVQKKGFEMDKNFWNLLLYFIIFGIIWYFIFYILKFSFVQKKDIAGVPTGEIDVGRCVVCAIIASLITILIIYLLRGK